MKMRVERDSQKTFYRRFPDMVNSHFNANPNSHKAVVEIKDDSQTRSQKQNALYWLWITTIGDEVGYTKDECALLMRDRFLGRDEFTNQAGTVEISQVKSTRKLNTKEFTRFLEQIDIFSSQELGITLPHPDDLYWQSMGVIE